MKLIVRRGEREEQVQVRRNGDGFEVAVGKRTYQVDAAAARASLRSLRIDGSQHEVAVSRVKDSAARGADDKYWVSSPSGAGPVSVTDPLTHLAAQTHNGIGARRREKVTAYMPGRVVAILVEEGQPVTAGQGIVVLEAMKMQNEIQAEHDGTLVKVHVQPGQAVEGGDPLFELG
ncbi:MAG TPA: biotin/lipoyl-containing protein [Thermoanaerobaculia bacterium]|nr:biotin/lipoyl-containing protein [Thermoanaerobaculia bacterium]